MSGYIVNQPQPHSAYAISKASVHHLARSMAGEWVGHGIRVNSISPGIMNTRLSGGPSQAGLRKLWLEKSPMVRSIRNDGDSGLCRCRSREMKLGRKWVLLISGFELILRISS